MEHHLLSCLTVAVTGECSTPIVLTMNHYHARQFDVRLRSPSGFSMIELLFVVAILGTVAAMAMMVSPAYLQHARAEGGVSQIIDVMRLAREVAISQRRNVEVRFIGLNAVQTRRIDIGVNGVQTGTTTLRTVELENGMQFRLEPGVPDTPDLFGMASATDFDLVAPWMFTSEGTFIGGSGDVTNGTVFLSIPGQPNSARAVTVMGTTALVRAWRWNGRAWVE
jgi:prepilin-type N-terminal cleavage/methylation domain-containing protein